VLKTRFYSKSGVQVSERNKVLFACGHHFFWENDAEQNCSTSFEKQNKPHIDWAL